MKVRNIYNFFIILILLVEYRFFFLLPNFALDNALSYQSQLAFAVVSIIFFLVSTILSHQVTLNKTIWLFIALSCYSALIVFTRYQVSYQSIIDPLIVNFSFLSVGAYVVYFRDRDNFNFFIKILTIFNIFAASLLLIQFVYFGVKGNLFLRIYEYANTPLIRNGLRIYFLDTMFCLSYLFSLGEFIKHKSKLHLFNMALTFTVLYFVSQTRILYLTIFLITVLFLMSSNNFYMTLLKTTILFLGFLLLIFFEIGNQSLLGNLLFFNENSDSTGSVYARQYAISYYFQKLEEYPLSGIGNFVVDNTSEYFAILHGDKGYANFSDIGFLGSISKYGLLFLIWFLIYMRGLIQRIKISDQIKIFVYFSIMTLPTLFIFDTQRIFLAIIFFSVSLSIPRTLDLSP